MTGILATYSITDLIVIVCAVGAAIIGIWKGVDYIWDKIRKHFDGNYHTKKEKEELLQRLSQHEQCDEENHTNIKNLIENLHRWQEEIEKQVKDYGEKVNMLIQSDRNAIKSYIVKEYLYFAQNKGAIDPYSLDIVELRYNIYKQEGGNSYIDNLINEIRKLPKVSLENLHKIGEKNVPI